jgi:hypothetical protein
MKFYQDIPVTVFDLDLLRTPFPLRNVHSPWLKLIHSSDLATSAAPSLPAPFAKNTIIHPPLC